MPKIVLLAGGTIGLGWLAVQAAAVEAFGRRAPQAAARFDPDDPRLPLAAAMIEFRTKAGAVSPATARAATAALADAPLAEEPFLLAGLSALIAERPAEAAPLLEEARRRNPRSRVTRLLLLDRYIRTGDVERAAAEISVLGRLMPAVNRVLVPELAKFATRSDSGPIVARVLRSDPGLQDRVLEHLAANGASPETVLRLAPVDLPPSGPGNTPGWQARLLQGLVDRGEFARARSLWARFAGLGEEALGQGVYDPRFQGRPGPAPFNWAFSGGSAGAADPAKGGGLQVEYYGRQGAELASQLLMLPPGRYRVAFRASGNTPGTESAVSWRIACHPAGAAIASVPIHKLTYTPRLISGDFTVPRGACPAQWLRLTGTPSEFPAAHSVTITDFDIRRAS